MLRLIPNLFPLKTTHSKDFLSSKGVLIKTGPMNDTQFNTVH